MEWTDIKEAPPVVLNIWDEDNDLLDSTDDFMGSAVIDLKQAATCFHSIHYKQQLNECPTPTWHKVRETLKPDSKECGEILCSFVVVPEEFKFQLPIEKFYLTDFVPTLLYQVKINALGLRELQSIGLLPVQKAYLKFNIRSMLPLGKDPKQIAIPMTEPLQPGSNPNLNTTISFIAELPCEKLYAPVLSCEVFDNICAGLK